MTGDQDKFISLKRRGGDVAFGDDSLLVVEPDYLPDSEVLVFQPYLYPMKYLHPRIMYTLPCGGVQRGGTLFAGSGGYPPGLGGLGVSPRKKIFLVNLYCNFIVNLDCSL
jgi:hypothetical protein